MLKRTENGTKKNKAYHKQLRDKWYNENKEHHKKLREEWYRKNKEHHSELMRKWNENNPVRVRAYSMKHDHIERAKKAGVKYKDIPLEFYTELIEKTSICPYRGKWVTDDMKMAIDHLVPLSRRGAHIRDNIILCCSKCNRDKHTKTVDEYLESTVYKETREAVA